MPIAFPLLAMLLSAGIPEAAACSCAQQRPPCEDYWTATTIFRGRVDSIEPAASSDAGTFSTARFTILEAFTGVSTSTVDVRTAVGPRTCGYRFARGREYLVYALEGSDGSLSTNVCTRTRLADKAHVDLEYARSVAGGGVALGRISGRVLLITHDLLTRRHHTRPIRGTAVTVRQGDFSASARTNRAGEFAITGLDPGPYSVGLDLAGSFRVETAPNPVVIRDARACAVPQISVYPDGRVSGRILDANTTPVRGLTVDLTVPTAHNSGPASGHPDRIRAVTRDDGSYELTGVPPGRFIVGISTGEDSARSPRTYFPVLPRQSDTATFSVPTGGRVALGDFVLPASLRLLEITGAVLSADQTPAEGARVYLRGPAGRDFILTGAVVTDLNGRFTIAAVEQEYCLFAERPRPGRVHGAMDSTDLLCILPRVPGTPVRLTLRPRY